MARVPQPAIPAGPVGSVAPEARGAPGLRLDVNADMFGASMGRSISKVGQAAEQVVGFAVKKAEQEDALKLRQLENEVAALDNEYTTQVQNLTGQAKLDFLNNSVDRYKEDLAKVTDKYQFTFENNTAVKGIYSKQATNKFTNFALGQRQEAYKTVLTETNKVSLANSTQAAVNNPALLQSPAFFNKIRSLVTDTETGMAAVVGETGSTPESKQRIETLSKEVEMQVIAAVANDQIAKGNFEDALNIIKQAKKTGEGLAVYTELQSKILPYETKIKGKQEFGDVYRSLVTPGNPLPNLAVIRDKISKIEDPAKRARVLAEFDIFSANQTAAANQRYSEQSLLVVQALLSGNFTPEFIQTVPDWAAKHPNEIITGQKQRQVISEQAATQARSEWESNGGGSLDFAGLEAAINLTFKSDPAAATALIDKGGLKGYFTESTYKALQSKAADHKKVMLNELSKSQATPSSILTDLLGFSEVSKKQLLKNHGLKFDETVNSVKEAAIKAGKPVQDSDLRKAVAQLALRIKVDEGMFFDSYDTYDYAAAVDKLDLDPNFDIFKARLDNTSRNHKAVAVLLNKTEAEIATAFDRMAGGDMELNIDNISSFYFESPSIGDVRRVQAVAQDISNLAVSSGLPPDFVRFLLRGANKSPTVDNAASVINEITTKGSFMGYTQDELLRSWVQ
jgi:hypothetical protein